MHVLIRNWPHDHSNDLDHRSDGNILDQDDQGQGIIDILSQSIISNRVMTVDGLIASICNSDFQFCNCPLCFSLDSLHLSGPLCYLPVITESEK